MTKQNEAMCVTGCSGAADAGRIATMGVKHKKRKRNSAIRGRHASTRGPFLVPSPLNGVGPDVGRLFAQETGAAAASEFTETLDRLVGLSQTVSAPHLLACCAFYHLVGAVSNRANTGRPRTHSDRVQQSHVEFLQALLLRVESPGAELPNPEIQRTVYADLPALFRAYALRNLGKGTTATDENADAEALRRERSALLVQEHLRAHTAGVRNWGYFSTVKRISIELLSRIDDDFTAVHAISATGLVELFEHLVRRFERRLSELLNRLKSVSAVGIPADMAEALQQQFPDDDLSEMQAHLRQPGMTHDDANFAILVGTESILPRYMVFDSGSVAAELGLDPKTLQEALLHLSLRPGSLAERRPDWLLLDNPVWTKPLIQLADDAFFCALPMTLMTFVVPIVESLVGSNGSLRTKLENARGKYLEDATESLLRRAFPDCPLARSFKWREGDQEFESDIAIRVDTTLFLVEAKSGRVSWPALRGAPERMVRDINELIVAPSNQSARLAQRLGEELNGTRTGEPLNYPIALEGLRSVVRLSVTLHDFATLQSIPRLVVDAGLAEGAQRLAPCISLADFEAVAELLDSTHVLLHYLRRRAELLLTVKTLGDELDMLGMYLDTGFNLSPEAETGQVRLALVGYSERVDRYFTGIDEGLPRAKPRPNVTQWIRALCDAIADRQFLGWTEVTQALLGLHLDMQQEIWRWVTRVNRRAAAGKEFKHGQNSLIVSPPPHRRVALVFHMRSAADRGPSSPAAGGLADKAFEAEHVDLCVFLSFRPTSAGAVYHAAAQLQRTDRQVDTLTIF